MTPDLKKKGTLTKLWNAHGKLVQWMSISGLLLTCAFLPSAAVAAQAAIGSSKAIGLLDVGKQFYSTAFNKIAENFIPGWGVLLQSTFNTVTNMVGAGASLLTNNIPSP